MKKRYFTLVELLVVIAIIGILAGMILGGVALARASARGAECKNNQKQMMEIEILAMDENNKFLVSGSTFTDSAGDDASWTRYLYGGDLSTSIQGKTAYISDMANLRCPSLKYDDDGQTLGAMSSNDRETALKAAYGMVYRASKESNAKFFGFDFRGTKFLKFGTGSNAYNISPNQLVLGGCASKDAPYDTADALLYSGGSAWDGKLVKIHSDKCNVFFLDGHVEELTKPELEKKYLPSASTDKPVKFPSDGWIDPDK